MKRERIFLLLLIVSASFLRLYRFRDFLEFLGDQGRDALVAKQILINHDITLLGPGTSVGNMYLGPLYYYLMVPSLAVTYPDPIGPALAVAVLGIVTTVFVYVLGKDIVGKRAAGIAAVLYVFAPVVVKLARFSWQPNPAPFFGLLMLWMTYKAWKGKTPYWIGAWISFVVLTQLHYVALLAAVPTGIVFFLDVWRNWEKRGKQIAYLKIVGVSFFAFSLSVLPLVIFDLRHDRLVTRGFQEYVKSRREHSVTLGQKVVQIIEDSHGVGMNVVLETLGLSKEHREFNTYLLIGTVVLTYIMFDAKKVKRGNTFAFALVTLWVVITAFGLTVYRNTVYAHYYAFAFPAVFLFIGLLLAYLSRKHALLAAAVSVGVIFLCAMNISAMPYWGERPFGITDVERIVEETLPFIEPGEKYNVALLNDNREYMAMKYRYFFDVSGKSPESQYDYAGLDKLIVIVENGEQPLDAPIYEVQEFKREVGEPVLEKQVLYRDAVNIYIYGKK